MHNIRFFFSLIILVFATNSLFAQVIPVEKKTLPNGIQLVYINDVTKNENTLFLYAKNQKIIEKKSGLSNITGQLLLGGIIGKEDKNWDDYLKKENISLQFNEEIFSLNFLNDNAADAISNFNNLFLKNSFSITRLDEVKNQFITQKIENVDSIIWQSNNLANKLQFGYPHPLSSSIEENEIRNITILDCKDFLKTCYQSKNIVIVVWGNFDKDKISDIIEQKFGKWHKSEPSLPSVKTSLAPIPNNYFIFPSTHDDSALITINYPLDMSISDDIFLRCKILESVLTEKIRLIDNVGSLQKIEIIPQRFTGGFSLQFFVSYPFVTSVIGNIQDVLNQLYLGRISDSEIEKSKKQLFDNLNFKDSKMVWLQAYIRRSGGNFGNIMPDKQQIKDCTLEQVKITAFKYLKPKNLNVLVAGNSNFYYKGIQSLGKYFYVSPNGNYIKWQPEVDQINAFLENNVLKNYIQKIGDMDVISKNKNLKLTYFGDYMGSSLSFKQSFFEDKFLFEWSFNGSVFQKQYYDGKNFKSYYFGELEVLDTSDVKDNLVMSKLFPELYFGINETKIVQSQTIKSDDGEAIEIKVKLPSGKIITEQFSKQTGLKIKSKVPMNSFFGLSEQISTYSEYSLFEGLLMPKNISIKNKNLDCYLQLFQVEKIENLDLTQINSNEF